MLGLLKFITCGSVDDGKSTLIGHMLYDAKLIFADQKRALELDSKVGSRDGAVDYSLLLDGLMAEREQGITIDVAYRYFSTERRSFIVADTPGHAEYTRNMAVGASFADLAIILVDVTQGVLTQTKRHARICSLMGIRHFVFAVNKMDLVRYSQESFTRIEVEINKLMMEFQYKTMQIIPVSATEGDNLTKMSEHMPWYQGGVLLPYLEQIEVGQEDTSGGFYMPVQRVCRPNHMFRGFQGQIEQGMLVKGDEITVRPSNENAIVKKIYVMNQEAERAVKGQPVTIQLDREIDVSRGCVMEKEFLPQVNSMFTTTLLWMDDSELLTGRNYFMKLGTKVIPVVIMDIKYRININNGEHITADHLQKNEIACCDVVASEPIVFEEFEKAKALGSFILIDRVSHMTSACGIVEHSLRRGNNLTWQKTDITRRLRAKQKSQKPATIWFTGLSGAGKSTLANELEKRLFAMGKHTMLLDGDNVRMGLNKNLGFKEADRVENIRRVAEVAKLMNDAGIIVLTAFISPMERDRNNAREIIGEDFIEVYVSSSLEVCEQRDIKGLYKKARTGEIPNFTGITAPFEVPEHPEIVVDAGIQTIEDSIVSLMTDLQKFMNYN